MKIHLKHFVAIFLSITLAFGFSPAIAQRVIVEEVDVTWESYESDLSFAIQRYNAHANQAMGAANVCNGDAVMGGISAAIDVTGYLYPSLLPPWVICGGVVLGVAAAALGATYYYYTLDAQAASAHAQQTGFMLEANRGLR